MVVFVFPPESDGGGGSWRRGAGGGRGVMEGFLEERGVNVGGGGGGRRGDLRSLKSPTSSGVEEARMNGERGERVGVERGGRCIGRQMQIGEKIKSEEGGGTKNKI